MSEMNKIRHCCYMIGQDLYGDNGGLKVLEDFPEYEDSLSQLTYMSQLLSKLEESDKEKYERRKKYIGLVIAD